MKRSILLISGIVVVGIGFYASYSVGNARGFAAGAKSVYDALGIPPLPPGATPIKPSLVTVPNPVKHHYEFQQRGASIFRFDLDTGEACWVQLSEADARTTMTQCPATAKTE
jgi:hypothetical protein